MSDANPPPGETTRLPRRLAILGLGLMGGSLGLAVRATSAEPVVVAGYDPAPGAAERARARGAIDQACASVAEAVGGADVVALAAPTLTVEGLLAELGAHVTPETIITDLCSVKALVVGWARALLPWPGRFVGGHPMAGLERSGIDAASAALYRGTQWIVTPVEETDPEALARVEALIHAVGARMMALAPETHDAAVAGASHLPLMVAVALTDALAGGDDWPLVAAVAAGGFRDTTRVAAGDPVMGRDILLANREEALKRLTAFEETLARLRAAVERGDGPAIEETLRSAQEARRQWETTR